MQDHWSVLLKLSRHQEVVGTKVKRLFEPKVAKLVVDFGNV